MILLNRIVILFTIAVNLVGGYKVLVFFPYPGKSHTILGEGYVRNLVNAGHNVTYVTPVPIKTSAPNLRQIDVASNFDNFPLMDALDLKKLLNNEIDITDVSIMYEALHDIAEVAIKHEKVQKMLLDTSEEFDVAIVEWLYSELYSGVPSVFNCPYIWSSSMETHPMVLRLIDEVSNPAYVPDHGSPVIPPLTFMQRVSELWNLILTYKIRWDQVAIETKAFNEAYGPAFAKRGRPVPSFEEVKFNASLMLGNSHVSSGLAVRLPQNYIPIAGYHIKKEIPPLPENLQKIMDNAQHGVIYFSLGTMMKGKTMPQEMKEGFLKAFSELKQVVIWKLEEPLPNLPKNVHIVEWAPQQSILDHPNTVLFVTHGGLLSTTETLHYGVPVIGIPLFADQFLNIKRAVTKGYGIHVPLSHNTPVELKAAIEEILTVPKYREKVKELSLIYHDRPVSPGDELVHWVEHVAKTQGAPHLRSIALLVPWYQKLYLDLLGLILFGLYVLVQIVRQLFPKNRRSPKKKHH